MKAEPAAEVPSMRQRPRAALRIGQDWEADQPPATYGSLGASGF
jgi:hypothetical protein